MDKIFILKIGNVYSASQSLYFFKNREDAIKFAVEDCRESEGVGYDELDDEMKECFDNEGQFCEGDSCYEITEDVVR